MDDDNQPQVTASVTIYHVGGRFSMHEVDAGNVATIVEVLRGQTQIEGFFQFEAETGRKQKRKQTSVYLNPAHVTRVDIDWK